MLISESCKKFLSQNSLISAERRSALFILLGIVQ